MSVFLDVDDLEDIGALEEYIEKTGRIMIFVSKGYFKSKNCLREVRATLNPGPNPNPKPSPSPQPSPSPKPSP